jgi:hypothetical protein
VTSSYHDSDPIYPGYLPRSILVVAGSAEIGYLAATVLGLTPVRALFTALGLGVGSAAALLIAFNWDSLARRSGLRRWLPALLVLALIAGPLVALSEVGDPTQVRPPDLSLSVVCRPAADGKSLTAHVEFRWSKTDLWPNGIGRDPVHDLIGLEPRYTFGVPDRAPEIGSGYSFAEWWLLSGPHDLAVDGLPDAGFGRPAQSSDPDYLVAVMYQLGYGGSQLEVSQAAVQPGHVYAADWTFGLGEWAQLGIADGSVKPEELGVDRVFLVADYGHAKRFVTHAYSACAAPSKTYTIQTEILNDSY